MACFWKWYIFQWVNAGVKGVPMKRWLLPWRACSMHWRVSSHLVSLSFTTMNTTASKALFLYTPIGSLCCWLFSISIGCLSGNLQVPCYFPCYFLFFLVFMFGAKRSLLQFCLAHPRDQSVRLLLRRLLPWILKVWVSVSGMLSCLLLCGYCYSC